MKKYILTDQVTLSGIIKKLLSKTLTARADHTRYTIESYLVEKDLNQSVHITLKSPDGPIKKPAVLVAIMKENKVEIRIKQVNPYLDDLFVIQEIIITPLERSAQRAAIKNISLHHLHYSPHVDITSLLSIYGKTSLVTQAIQNFETELESILNRNGYFITSMKVGFYYSVDTPLLNNLADSKTPYFLRDAYRKDFYSERTFYNPEGKMKQHYLDSMIQKHLIENIKSVLIIPFFGSGNVLIGYVELRSSLPNLGNKYLNDEIESAQGLSTIVDFIESKCENFTYELELSYVKEWRLFSEKDDIIDISQDGRGMGCYLNHGSEYNFLQTGAKIAFKININQQDYEFYGSVRNLKPAQEDKKARHLGVRIYLSSPSEGIPLLASYANQLIAQDIK
ncbi:MAG: hypothetical protein AAF518_00280 [Spirochaetota bacterium]